MDNSHKHLRVSDDDDSIESRVKELEGHFESGGRVDKLEHYKTFLSGIWCSATFVGAFAWYLLERLFEALKK